MDWPFSQPRQLLLAGRERFVRGDELELDRIDSSNDLARFVFHMVLHVPGSHFDLSVVQLSSRLDVFDWRWRRLFW